MTESEKKLNSIWRNMKYRCYSKNLKEETAKHYRDKGIKVCDEWLNDFGTFKDWSLSHGYKPGLSIDRIDPDGNYEPSNCQWVTLRENSRRATSKEEKRFYVASGDISEYSQKFEAKEILSDAMTYADAESFMKEKYGDDNRHYRVVRSRIIPKPKLPEPQKPKGPSTADRLLQWLASQDVNALVEELDEPSRFVVAATVQALVLSQRLQKLAELE